MINNYTDEHNIRKKKEDDECCHKIMMYFSLLFMVAFCIYIIILLIILYCYNDIRYISSKELHVEDILIDSSNSGI